MKNNVLFAVFAFALVCATPAFAVTITPVMDYGAYSTGFLTSATGRQIDLSTAGFTFDLGSPFIGSGSTGMDEMYVFLNSPDGTTTNWWVYARMTDIANVTNPDGFVVPPPNVRISVSCAGGAGGTYNVTTTLSNSTWNTDYVLFNIDMSDSSFKYYAIPSVSGNTLTSPTGRDLTVKEADCHFQVYPDDWGNNTNRSIRFSVWNVNPDRNALCSIDPAVTTVQESTLGIVNINYQVWTIAFQFFEIVVILVGIFGIPILLIRLIRKVVDEVKDMLGKRKVF